MALLYSLNASYPAPLPFRVSTPNGLTRTDPSTFTEEELAEWGYTGPYSYPEYDSFAQTVDWTGSSFVIRDLTDPELDVFLAEKKLDVRKHRNSLLSSCDWTQLSDAPVDGAAWATYRQELRDVTAQVGFPWEITWPNEPIT